MEFSLQSSRLWEEVMEQTKVAKEKGIDPLLWALQVSSSVGTSGIALPSTELAQVLVNYICWDNNIPILWKFLDKALMMKIIPPLLVIALLSQRVMESIDATLHLSEIFGLQTTEPAILVVEFIFSIVWQLLDASLDDEGLLELTEEKVSRWAIKPQEMEIDGHDMYDEKNIAYRERLQNFNTTMAIEIIGQFLQNKVTSRILYLARRNMSSHWVSFIQSLQLLGANSAALKNSKVLTSEALLELTSDSRIFLSRECKTSSRKKFHAVMAFGSLASSVSLCPGASRSDLWLPLDMVLEDAMDGYLVNTTSAVEIITGLTKTLQAINGTNWHDTFLGLWIASLRLVQRERDPIEGPMPRLDTRLCMLLSIMTLVVADLIEEEEGAPTDETEYGSTNHWKEMKFPRKRRADLVSSLQVLGDYQDLLAPPKFVVSAANQAAAKAMLFVSGINIGSAYFEGVNIKDMPFTGNLRHLIIEACIARNLLDTSAYYWPGYVNGRINQLPYSVPAQAPGWSSFMKGAPLTSVMINALVSSPASSLAELEKIFEIAVNGSEDEKISAATILCGASLIRGWNIQEYTVQFITRLMSPPVPADFTGSDSHLIDYAPMLNVLIVGIASVDCVQIFSLHGLVPQLACSLMPICEVFGSCVPNLSWTLPSGEEISPHAVFSNAFALLLKLWRFNHPPIEHGVGDVPTVGSQLTPEYLLLVRNSHLLSSENTHKDRNKRRLSEVASSSSPEPVFLDSFPKLKVWYRQHQRCIAATLSGLVHGTTVHQTVDRLLNMMFRKINKGSQSITSVTSGSSSSSGAGIEDNSLKPELPAWDILEAVPYVVDAALTACAHGKLSPRELATGLKDLADFLPASLATIVSYFSAEVSRCVWKPVVMNGMDWPSPAANLSNVEEHIKKILAATGVDVPRLSAGGSSPATLPLPLAAFVSVTITYKIDKTSERFLNLAGPALESLAADCPWPCMPIVASLWTQKAKRWFDFLVFSASRTVFLHNSDAIVQLLKSCFTATLGLNIAPISSNGGVGALLGHGFGSHFCGGLSPVAPGILYLRVYRSIRDIVFITEEVVSLLMHSVREIACSGLPKQKLDKLKRSKNGMKYGQVSLAAAMTRVKLAASLAASLVWLSGGHGLVQSLIKETLPSWFISVHRSDRDQGSGLVAMLGGYALAYFTVLCGAFAWGVDSSSSASKRRPKILGSHMEFLASALDGKISLGCDGATWHAYVSGFVSLMVGCTPNWVLEVDVDVLRRLSKGLRQWHEEELALALLGIGGVGTMGAAAELIIEHFDS
ncbi:mediator of RNA polymerase II transcription subunit 33A [Gossypium australe]|uniref:Mediator of RNA polymerase II transcription subunit 33A n=1 Tax=Gossypium australe TaxID=47621 RepID=A0A5B6WVJ9_9ROSI|nr:mediator of RNA polymerase II transcription subunit 33A [Gossypium australe]